MKVTIHLHKEIADALMCFGSLSDVVNKILSCDEIDIMDKPPCPPKDNCKKYVLNITNQTYIDLYDEYGASSPRISLRRLLYWFVDNEMYTELAWQPIQIKTPILQDKYLKKLDNAKTELRKALNYTLSVSDIVKLKDLITQIGELYEKRSI